MVKNSAAQRTSERVASAALEEGVSLSELSRRTQIPLSSLRRKIASEGKYEFNISELLSVAEALNRHPADLLAPELHPMAKAG